MTHLDYLRELKGLILDPFQKAYDSGEACLRHTHLLSMMPFLPFATREAMAQEFSESIPYFQLKYTDPSEDDIVRVNIIRHAVAGGLKCVFSTAAVKQPDNPITHASVNRLFDLFNQQGPVGRFIEGSIAVINDPRDDLGVRRTSAVALGDIFHQISAFSGAPICQERYALMVETLRSQQHNVVIGEELRLMARAL